MAAEQRTERISVRLAPTERKMLAELAQESGLDEADIIRTLIRQEHEKKHPKKPKS